ncbi:cytochrome c [Primorskyibacter aestuariivivens]|uniref:c-type cytochrome n=1 Tax=Primorskyibacter aestuariivivens TaxID=1888912 RepID=UPI0023009B30|nr:cytochrome c [Primorskyibacter aestuariivivens]MDA7429370.1 cytochrome c [Primorskyibacter aestuariivivens]
MKKTLAIMVVLAGTGAALAHTGVKNKTVLERMDGMKALAEQVKVLGDMAKGKTAYDADRAAAARTALIEEAAKVTAEFEAPETDPKSEALPVIWSDWDGFVSDARALENAVAALDTGSLDGVRAGLGAVGQSCSGCHEDYRLDK